MSNGLNHCTFIGNLGADPELRFGQNGNAILRLRLAVNEKWKDASGERKERTEWVGVVFFGARAEGLAKHLSKGDRVYVSGRMQTRVGERDGAKRYFTEIVGNELVFCGGGGRRDGGGERRQQSQRQQSDDSQRQQSGDDFGSDDIPF